MASPAPITVHLWGWRFKTHPALERRVMDKEAWCVPQSMGLRRVRRA